MADIAGALDEVADGVFRLELLPVPLDGLTSVNTYLIPGDTGVTAIDSGWDNGPGCAAFTAGLATPGFGLDDVTRFCVTHAHPGHNSLTLAARSDCAAKTLLGDGERISLAASAPDDSQQPDFPRLMARAGEASASARAADPTRAARLQPGQPDGSIGDSAEFDTGAGRLTAIATPGHWSLLRSAEHGLDIFAPVSSSLPGNSPAVPGLANVSPLRNRDRSHHGGR